MFARLNPIQGYVDRAVYHAIPEADRQYLEQYVKNPDNRAKVQSAREQFDKTYGKGAAGIVLGVR